MAKEEVSFRFQFKNRLRHIRESLGMTQEEFAKFLGLSRPTIGFYERADKENGRIPDAEVLKRICEKCEVSADYLLGITDENAISGLSSYTGLSQTSIEYLHNLTVSKWGERSAILDHLLMLRDFDTLLAYMEQYIALKATKTNAKYIETAEFKLFKDILEKHGYIVASASYEAKETFEQRIEPTIKSMLDLLADLMDGADISSNHYHDNKRHAFLLCDYHGDDKED